jgi:hypothetical protein
MLYAVPVVLIVAGRIRGCRPEERRLIATIACVATAAFLPTLIVSVFTADTLLKGCAYALAVVAGAHWAMLLGSRPGRDDPPGGGGDDAEPEPPFDWDEFERDFWDEVRRRRPPRVPA